MKNPTRYLAYTRVSTVKQGRQGVSLEAQKDMIARYCERHSLHVSDWITETVTAAKQGRPAFEQMLSTLKSGSHKGVVMHKIDRSARNLKDWTRLLDLLDQGVELHFCSESIDLNSRGGRLSADIQAVVAADMIRNQMEEVRKGMQGRLRQGLWPWGAPLGYLNQGGGRPKTPDPERAHLVTRLFELYAEGSQSLRSLAAEAKRMGLTTTWGGDVTWQMLSKMLANPFYMGTLLERKTGRRFKGVHEPIVSARLFQKVRHRAEGKSGAKVQRHDFLYRRRIRCSGCGRRLVGERQKGHVYYRCHTRRCATPCLPERVLDSKVRGLLGSLRLKECVRAEALRELREAEVAGGEREVARASEWARREAYIETRKSRLSEGYMSGVLDAETVKRERSRLDVELQVIREDRASVRSEVRSALSAEDKLELAMNLHSCWEQGTTAERREILDLITSNRTAGPEGPVFMPSPLVSAFLEVRSVSQCWEAYDGLRTVDGEIRQADKCTPARDEAREQGAWAEDPASRSAASRGKSLRPGPCIRRRGPSTGSRRAWRSSIRKLRDEVESLAQKLHHANQAAP